MPPETRGALFELGGAPAPARSELTIGPWTQAPPGLVAFDAGARASESVWRIQLARVDAASHAALDEGAQSIARAHAALDDLPQRFERALAEPPHELPSFSVEEPGRLERALQRAGDLARGRARIETRIAGALVARSITTLSGDTELWISPGLSTASAAMHARSVAIAVRTRHAWARTLALVVAYGGRIAALGSPASVTAWPLWWRLLRDVLREVRAPAPAAAR